MSMTSTEAAMLCRYVAACCPQQKFDQYTPDAWFDLLEDIPFDIAKKAASECAKRRPFVAPAEIRTAVRMMRSTARASVRHLVIRDADAPFDAAEYGSWMRANQARANDLADEVIRNGAIDLSRVHLEDADAAPSPLPVDMSRLPSLPEITAA